eukprot:4031669-Prymnesium_polylepis.1
MLVTPQSEADWDTYAEEEREFERKQAAIARRELGRATAARESEREKTQVHLGAAPAQQKQTFVSKLTAQILERLQVDVTNICIRYVDSSHGAVPYSISLHLKSLHVRSAERDDAAPPKGGAAMRSSPRQGSCSNLQAAAAAGRTSGMTKVLHIVGLSICCEQSSLSAIPPALRSSSAARSVGLSRAATAGATRKSVAFSDADRRRAGSGEVDSSSSGPS